MGKRVIAGVIALVVFGLFLVWAGRLPAVQHVAASVLPKPAPAPSLPTHASPSTPDTPVPGRTSKPKPAPGPLDLTVAPGAVLPSSVEAGGKINASAVLTLLGRVHATPEPADGYERSAFGSAWADVDHNGCDTRDDILTRDLTDRDYRAGTHGCVVVSGDLVSDYTGQEIHFTKAEATKVQIDHMVPLSYAWINGANTWTADERRQFANDPINLTAVDGRSNEQKSDKGPAEWMPQSQSYACTYVARFVFVTVHYSLTMPDRDRQSIRRTLAGC